MGIVVRMRVSLFVAALVLWFFGPVHGVEPSNGCAAFDGKLSKIEARIRKTKKQLSAYSENPEQFEADLAQWVNLAAGARGEAIRAAKEAVVSVALHGLAIQNEAAIELTKEQQRSVRKLLEAYGPILNYARKFSAQRLAALKTDAAIIKYLADIKTAADLLPPIHLNPDDREELLTAIANILGVFVKDPRLGLVLTDAGILVAAVYGWTKGGIAYFRIRQLIALSEHRLRAVNVLSLLYRDDIDKRKSLREKIAEGCPDTPPPLPPEGLRIGR